MHIRQCLPPSPLPRSLLGNSHFPHTFPSIWPMSIILSTGLPGPLLDLNSFLYYFWRMPCVEFGQKTRHWLLGRSQLFTVKGTVSVDMGFDTIWGPQTFGLRGLKRLGWVALELLLEAPLATTTSLRTLDLSAEIPGKSLILFPAVCQSGELWGQGSRPQCRTYHKLLLLCPHPDSDCLFTSSPSTPCPPKPSHLQACTQSHPVLRQRQT